MNNATNGFVGHEITNNQATIAYVNSATNGFVGAGITNGLFSGNATTNYVVPYVNTVSNALAAQIGSGGGGSATNAIGNNNGRGTNTTLVGTTWLLNSNLPVYLGLSVSTSSVNNATVLLHVSYHSFPTYIEDLTLTNYQATNYFNVGGFLPSVNFNASYN